MIMNHLDIVLSFHLQKKFGGFIQKWPSYGVFCAATWIFLKICYSARWAIRLTFESGNRLAQTLPRIGLSCKGGDVLYIKLSYLPVYMYSIRRFKSATVTSGITMQSHSSNSRNNGLIAARSTVIASDFHMSPTKQVSIKWEEPYMYLVYYDISRIIDLFTSVAIYSNTGCWWFCPNRNIYSSEIKSPSIYWSLDKP